MAEPGDLRAHQSVVPHHEHGGVVLVADALRALDHRGGERARVHARDGGDAREPYDLVEALLDAQRRSLHHTVREQHEHSALGEPVPGDRVVHAALDPEGRSALVLGDTGLAVRRGPHARDVPGPGALQEPGGGVEPHEGAGGEEIAAEGEEQLVGPGEELAGLAGDGGEGAQADPDLPHERGRLYVVALDVADGQADAPVRHREGVVPVAAHVEAVAGGRVLHGQAESGGHGQVPGQHAALEGEGQLDAGALQLRALARLGGQRTEPGQQLVAVVRGALAGH